MYKHLTEIRERNSGFRYLNSVKISFRIIRLVQTKFVSLEQVRSLEIEIGDSLVSNSVTIGRFRVLSSNVGS